MDGVYVIRPTEAKQVIVMRRSAKPTHRVGGLPNASRIREFMELKLLLGFNSLSVVMLSAWRTEMPGYLPYDNGW